MIRITVSTLRQALAQVIAAIPARPSFPELSGVSLSSDGTALTLRGTDLRMSIERTVPLTQFDDAVELLVPARLLFDVVSAMPQDAVAELSRDGDRARLSVGRNVSHLAAYNPEAFPQFPTTDRVIATVDAAFLAHVNAAVAIAAARDDSRPTLTAINLNAADGVLTAVAADGFQLALARTAIDPGVSYDVLLMAQALGAAVKINDTGHVVISTNTHGGHVALNAPGWTITASGIVGTYPDFRRIIPQPLGTTAIIEDRGALLRALNLVALVADQFVAALQFSADGVTVSGAGDAHDATAVVPAVCRINGGPERIAVNARYLIGALSSNSGPVALRSQSAQSALCVVPVIDGVAAVPHTADDLHVIMPMTLRS